MSLFSKLRTKNVDPNLDEKTGTATASPPAVAALMREANALFRAGRFEDARFALQRVLERNPRHAQALYTLGGIALNDGDLGSALGLVRMAIEADPTNAEFHVSLATVFRAVGQFDDAIRSFETATRLRPDAVGPHLALTATLRDSGRLDEAEVVASKLVARWPSDSNAHIELGILLQQRGRLIEAEQAFWQAAGLAPESAAAHINLAMARRDRGYPAEAEAPAREAVKIAPRMPEAWFTLGSVLLAQSRHAEAVEQFRASIALQPDYEDGWSGLLFAMHYSDQWSAAEIYEKHVEWGKRFAPVAGQPTNATPRVSGRRVRIGYLSGDLYQHPVAHFLEAPLRHRDRGRFEVYCYHASTREDAVSTRLRGYSDHWRPVAHLSDDALASAIRDDGIDILVELSGHTKGQRLQVLVRRPAPVQVTYLGYPNTTGLAQIDFRITDARADPPGESDKWHVERLIRLPETFLCYTPAGASPELQVSPLSRKGHITFGSFNNCVKINATTIALWARILSVVPRSKLLIKSWGLLDPGLGLMFLERFRAAGIAPDRIQVARPTADHKAHMDSYREVDIALDTFPYHGTTTTLDALWMGTPVVTLAGDRHLSRVGVSILSALALDELIAQTPQDYVNKAAELAGDPSRLAGLRATLRERVANSPLTNGPRFAAALEGAYCEMLAKPVA